MSLSGQKTFSPSAVAFQDKVLSLKPAVAAFDCDGTLWSGDAGETFFDWEVERGIVSADTAAAVRARYVEYRAGRVSEDDMCGELVTMHRGMRDETLVRAATDFFEHGFPGSVFAEMRDLVRRLIDNGCEVWAVSSSNQWIIEAGMKHFGIANDRVLAAAVAIENGVITDRLTRVPSGPGKPKALRDFARKNIDAAFGNSRWDTEMLAMAQHPFAVNPNPDLEASARQRGWTVYFPDGTRS